MIKLKNWPTDSRRITSQFGPRWGAFHDGVDIGGVKAGIQGDPLYAVADGIVRISKTNNGGASKGYGHYIVITHDGFSTVYGHMQHLGLKVGTKVKAGQVIGYMGNTGNSTATHLHFRLVNSESVSFVIKTDLTTPYSVDPEPYLLQSEEVIQVSIPVNTPEVQQTVSTWAVEAHQWVKTNQVSDGTRPKDVVTREEVWAMIHRASKLNK